MQQYKNKNILKLAISILIVGLFGWYIFKNWQDLSSLMDISLPIILGILILNILRIQNNANFLRYSLKPLKTKLAYLESFYIALITAIGNFFGPLMGGVGVRSIYLKKKHNVSHSDHAATLSGFYIITFLTSSLIGLVSLGFIYLDSQQSSFIVTAAFGGWFIFSLLLTRLRSITKLTAWVKVRAPLLHPIVEKINNVLIGWRTIKQDKPLVVRLFWITIVGFLIQYAIFYLQFIAIGASPSIFAIALYVSLSTFSLLVSITPGAIGIREAIFIFTNVLLGITTEQIVAVAVIDRSTTFIILGIAYLVVKTPIFNRYSSAQS